MHLLIFSSIAITLLPQGEAQKIRTDDKAANTKTIEDAKTAQVAVEKAPPPHAAAAAGSIRSALRPSSQIPGLAPKTRLRAPALTGHRGPPHVLRQGRRGLVLCAGPALRYLRPVGRTKEGG